MSDEHAQIITGSCLCGAVEFELTNAFRFFFFCYCEQCRRLSGTAHIANLSSETNSLLWKKGQEQIARFDMPGRNFTKAFCKTCASPVPYVSNETGRTIVPAGCLHGAPIVESATRIFVHEAPPWSQPEALSRLPGHKGYPPEF